METTSSASVQAATVRSGDWRVDEGNSFVRFHTRAMFNLFPVVGRFDRFDGTLHVDDSGRVSGELTIEASSIKTGVALRDWHLRSRDFFHVARHPQLSFTLDGLEPDGDSHLVTGVLRIREAPLPVRASATVAGEGSEMTIRARFEVDHHKAGLGWAKPGMVPKSVEADVRLALRPI
jgi:polyisoprenoid-binding protein YceI